MKGNNYINERLKNPKYAIMLNGKEVKKLPFLRQAKQYTQKINGKIFGDMVEIIDLETGEIFG